MELFELLEWLLPKEEIEGTGPGTGAIAEGESIGGINNEEELFSYIHTALQLDLHAFSILIGMADTNGVITQWWLEEKGALSLADLPGKVQQYYLRENAAGLATIDIPDRRDALKAVLYNNGIKECMFIPLGNFFRNYGFICLLSPNKNNFPSSLQSRLKKYQPVISAACLRLLLIGRRAAKQQMASVEDEKEKKLIGGNVLAQIMRQVKQVAPTDATVLLTGETGTGKELFAESVHYNSPRRDKAMIKVNCAALPSQLIESELFGHEKGAFTGALQRRTGKFEMADGGTLFLDEIGELPLDLQAKLLRAIQEKEIERLGGSKPIKVDVRIIAATNRILEDEVRAGRFRQDLYYRLLVFPIHLPALRDRKEDIPLLARYFMKKAASKYGKAVGHIDPVSMDALINYSWPGNIRELEHMVERAVIAAASPTITITVPVHQQMKASDISPPPLLSLADAEREAIVRALKYCNGRIRGPQGAADILDIKPTTLEARMKKLGIVKQHVIYP